MGHMNYPLALLINGRAAPVSSARFAGIVRKRPVLDSPIRHIKPVVIEVHLHTSRGHTVRYRPTIILVAAARAVGIVAMQVDVVGLVGNQGSPSVWRRRGRA